MVTLALALALRRGKENPVVSQVVPRVQGQDLSRSDAAASAMPRRAGLVAAKANRLSSSPLQRASMLEARVCLLASSQIVKRTYDHSFSHAGNYLRLRRVNGRFTWYREASKSPVFRSLSCGTIRLLTRYCYGSGTTWPIIDNSDVVLSHLMHCFSPYSSTN